MPVTEEAASSSKIDSAVAALQEPCSSLDAIPILDAEVSIDKAATATEEIIEPAEALAVVANADNLAVESNDKISPALDLL